MTEELKKEILNILDNVSYWETCPQKYKDRIEAIKKQLMLGGVVKSFYCFRETAKNGERCETPCSKLNKCMWDEPQ